MKQNDAASPFAFWAKTADELLRVFQSDTEHGLTAAEVEARLKRYGLNQPVLEKPHRVLRALAFQFINPLVLILVGAATLSFLLHDVQDALIILAIVLMSGLLGFYQEYRAEVALGRLRRLIQVRSTCLRQGKLEEITIADIVPGDILKLSAGDVVPADCAIVNSRDLFVDESLLTGETFPYEKSPGRLDVDLPISKRTNSLFAGTHVTSGEATALVVATAAQTELGKIGKHLINKAPETDFERNLRHFGFFLMEVTLIIVFLIFAFNVYFARPVLEAFLFSLAIAVGLTPQLLPAIISVNLAHGAQRMAAKKAIVKRLSSIENFGSMTVLCSDKTGTLTKGRVEIHSALDLFGNESSDVLRLCYLNAAMETGFKNPIDEAIRRLDSIDISRYQKLDEIPYDFLRRRISILFREQGNAPILATKGAVQEILQISSKALTSGGGECEVSGMRNQIENRLGDLSAQGLRVLAVAYRRFDETKAFITKEDERDMVIAGFLVLFDPPKRDAREMVRQLGDLGIQLKVITGDNHLVGRHLAEIVGMKRSVALTGDEISRMSDQALAVKVREIDMFTEIEPNQKERIVRALRASGYVVGYMGDGINDLSAMHSADVSISVEGAADVAKGQADLVLLEQDLSVVCESVLEGRRTSANTLKYMLMATSANFGNMFSMAGASMFLPFLPLLPKQILTTNFLTDLPELTIATDKVDREMLASPLRWDLKFIRKFMLWFGLLSSFFDYVTFGVLIWMGATPAIFRTCWFIESVLSASLVVLVIRTRRVSLRSVPSLYLLTTTVAVAVGTVFLPLTPLAKLLDFEVPPPSFLLALVGILITYLTIAERLKLVFYRRFSHLLNADVVHEPQPTALTRK